MKLKDKFKIINCKDCDIAYCDTKCTILAPSELIKLEQVADDFAIGFAEFIEGTYSYSNIFDYWYLHADTSKTYTKKQLLNQYKKEKGL